MHMFIAHLEEHPFIETEVIYEHGCLLFEQFPMAAAAHQMAAAAHQLAPSFMAAAQPGAGMHQTTPTAHSGHHTASHHLGAPHHQHPSSQPLHHINPQHQFLAAQHHHPHLQVKFHFRFSF